MIKKIKKHNFLHPVSALLIGAFIISFSSVLVKTSDVPSLVSAFYRVFFGSIFLFAACAGRREFKKRPLKNNLLAVLAGLIFAIDLGAWHMSIHYIGPGLATILGNFEVFGLTCAGFFLFKEKLGVKFFLAVPMAFAGLFLIIGVDAPQISQEYILGVLLGLLTALCYTIFILLLRKLQTIESQFSLFYYLMLVSLSSAFFLGTALLFTGTSFAIPHSQSLSSLVMLGFFQQTVAWVLISNALPLVKASHTGLILLLQPSLSFVWDCIFFKRSTGTAGWIGVIIVLAAIYAGTSDKSD